jgi:hypothetical protein
MSRISAPVRWAIVIAIVAATGYAVARSKRDFWDFEVYRTAGVRALAAEPLYRAEDLHYQYKYWPAFAFVMVPFGFIPPEAGKIIWYALSVALLAVFIRQSILALPDRRSSMRFLTWWTLLLAGKFIVRELVNGQTNTLFGVLIVLAIRAAQQRRRAASGLLVGAATFVKPYALVFLPWLLIVQGMTAVSAALAVLVTSLTLPAIVYGWQGNMSQLVAWYHTVVGTTPENVMVAENISFASMWAKWVGAGPTASTLAALTTAVVLLVAVAVWWRRRGIKEPGYLEAGLLLLLVPLVSPQGWDYVLLIAVPALVCLVDRFRGDQLVWRAVTVAGFILTSFAIYDLMGRQMYLWLVRHAGMSVGALLLVASLVHQRVRGVA